MKLSISLLVLSTIICVTNVAARNFHKSDPELGHIEAGDVQLKVLKKDTRLYKSGPLYPKQKRISHYMRGTKRGDWSGQYYALKESVAKSYGANYLTGGKGGFYLRTFKVEHPFYVLRITKQSFGHHSISQELKAQKLKEFFKMHGLGNIAAQDFHKQRKDNYNEMRSKFIEISNQLRDHYSKTSRCLVPNLYSVDNDFAMECPHDASNSELIFPTSTNVATKLKEISKIVVVSDPEYADATFASLNAVTGTHKHIIDDQKATIDREREGGNLEVVGNC